MRRGRPEEARRALFDLVLILGLVWITLIGYALLPRPLTLGGLTLRQSDIADAVLGPRSQLARGLVPRPPLPSPVRRAKTSVRPEAPVALPPARSERILLFGDSMIDELMLRLADYCQANDHTLLPAVWYAAGTVHWAQDDKLYRLVNEFEPTVAIAVLGSNELTTRRTSPLPRAIRAIRDRLGAVPLLWIGPPNWRQDTGINAILERELTGKAFFRSADLDLARKPDGI
ncbi:MAG: hypothetical protein AAGA56_24790, partial [Myxococcota bacterium]